VSGDSTTLTYREPTVMWRLRHRTEGAAHAVVLPSGGQLSAVWYLRGTPEAARDLTEWSDALRWLGAVRETLEAHGWREDDWD
jgi:hypothetical protein